MGGLAREPVPVSSEVTANSHLRSPVLKLARGEALGDVGVICQLVGQ